MATLLSTTGYGCTGSSAVTNILEEFDGIKSLGNKEFTFAHEPDGIADLENSLREGHRLKTDLAVKRFLALAHELASSYPYNEHFNGKFEILANEYMVSITNCRWTGWWPRAFETKKISISENFNFCFTEQLFNWRLKSLCYDAYEPDAWFPNYKPVITMYYKNISDKADEADFLQKTRKFTDKLLQEENTDNKFRYILLDQATPPISLPRYSRYFTCPKTIIIDRDPRDLFTLNKALWGVGYIPSTTVEQFIRWYAETRKNRENEILNDGASLFLQFEELIYEYNASLNKIYAFIDMPEKYHINKLKCFKPDLSIQNTQVFLEYPDLFSDIDIIEKRLEEYCYPFPERRKHIRTKYFLIQTINNEVEYVQSHGRLPLKYRWYTPYILYRTTYFYHTFSFFIIELKKRKGFSLLKLFIKSPVMMFFPFIILPVNFLVNLVLHLVSINKTESSPIKLYRR
jgi:hypothetical protein